MNQFAELLRQEMETRNLSLRGLEAKINDRFGYDSVVRKSTLQHYLKGKPPKYTAVLQIAFTLEVDTEEWVRAAYDARLKYHENEESRKLMDILADPEKEIRKAKRHKTKSPDK